MLQNRKKWVDVIKAYKESSLLWDTKHRDYLNKALRQEAFEKVFKVYKLIDKNATLMILKKKLENMRTTYNRERKKADLLKKKGSKYVPNLWYFKYLRFLDGLLEIKSRGERIFNFNRHDNKLYLERNRPLKRKRIDLNHSSPKSQEENEVTQVERLETSDEEDNTEIQQSHPTPKNRLIDLLQRQEKFVATVTKLITKKDDVSQLVGKSIGHQLCSLDPEQKTIAQKLINDAIYYASMDKLTAESFIYVNEMPIEEEHVYYIDPESV